MRVYITGKHNNTPFSMWEQYAVIPVVLAEMWETMVSMFTAYVCVQGYLICLQGYLICLQGCLIE